MQALLERRVPDALAHPRFVSEVLTPLKVEALLDRPLHALSGGEQQRVALALALGTPADLYLIDEPSAYLDSEQRLVAAPLVEERAPPRVRTPPRAPACGLPRPRPPPRPRSAAACAARRLVVALTSSPQPAR